MKINPQPLDVESTIKSQQNQKKKEKETTAIKDRPGLKLRPWVAVDVLGWLVAVGMGRCGCVGGRVRGSWLGGDLVRSATW